MFVLLRQVGDGFDFEQEFFTGQPANLDQGHGGRALGIDVAVAYFAESENLRHVHNVHIQFDHAGKVGSNGSKRGLEVFKDLLGLGMEIIQADDLARWTEGDLAGDKDGPPSRDLDNLGVTWRWRER